MHNYKKLDIWKDAMELAYLVHELTQKYPKHEQFGLAQQSRNAGYSIPSNIAEGAGRHTDKDFNRFLGIAYGSLCELDTQLILANRFKYLADEGLHDGSGRIEHLQKRIYKLQTKFS